jgi:phospholipase C
MRPPARLLAIAALLSAGACASHATSETASYSALPSLPVAPFANVAPGSKIKHVVIIVQENRSFDNVFDCFKGTECVTTGKEHDGTVVRLQAVKFDAGDINHNFHIAMNNWDNGKMDGFDRNTFGSTGGSGPVGSFPYAYLDKAWVQPYLTMAHEYTLLDRMFPDMFGPSFTAHQSLIAGTTVIGPQYGIVNVPKDLPWTCNSLHNTTALMARVGPNQPGYHVQLNGKGPRPCLSYPTMADTLDAKGISWKYYAPALNSGDVGGQAWSAFNAIDKVFYGPDKAKVISPQTQVLLDAKNGQLADVSWVIPDLQDSDHPSSYSNHGPSWVATVVNAIGESKYWNSTAIVVVWDDWGGWYDHVPPPQLDYVGLGIRVPGLIISPYARAGTVVHTQYEFGSILHFVEDVYGLPRLGGTSTDARSASLTDSFNFAQQPIKFVPIQVPETPEYFLKRRPSYEAPDQE